MPATRACESGSSTEPFHSICFEIFRHALYIPTKPLRLNGDNGFHHNQDNRVVVVVVVIAVAVVAMVMMAVMSETLEKNTMLISICTDNNQCWHLLLKLQQQLLLLRLRLRLRLGLGPAPGLGLRLRLRPRLRRLRTDP